MGVSLEIVKRKKVPVFFLYTQYFTSDTSVGFPYLVILHLSGGTSWVPYSYF